MLPSSNLRVTSSFAGSFEPIPERPTQDFPTIEEKADVPLERALRKQALACLFSVALARGAVVNRSTSAGTQSPPICEREAHAMGVDAISDQLRGVTND
jgi:hypothetical protein